MLFVGILDNAVMPHSALPASSPTSDVMPSTRRLISTPSIPIQRSFVEILERRDHRQAARGDVRDQIVSHKNDHRPSYRSWRALQQRSPLKIDFREILATARFPTFATVSAQSGPSAPGTLTLADPEPFRNI
jgi:hypothetical protein